MNTTVVCREIRPGTEDRQSCLVVAASEDERGRAHLRSFPDVTNVSEVQAQLQARGIVLGGSPPRGAYGRTATRPSFPVRITAQDDRGNECVVMADSLEEYSLSSGSTLYYLRVPGAPAALQWLVGRTLELTELRPAGTAQAADPTTAESSVDDTNTLGG
jgi:hypothetical protein